MKVAALGRTHWLYDSILTVAEQGHEIVLIGTCRASPEYKVQEADFAQLATELNCAFFSDTAINRTNYVKMIAESGADVAISVNWLTLIGQTVIDQFKHGIINAHVGDLPRYRGNAVPNWAILAGEEQVVLTLHEMTTMLDAGPIWLKRGFPLKPDTYIADVYQFMDENVPTMFGEVLRSIETGERQAQKQPEDPALSLRCFPRLPQDSQIDWSQSAEKLGRLVRASAEPFTGAYTFFNKEKLIIWRARPTQLHYPYLGTPGQVVEREKGSGAVLVITGEGVLSLQEIETERLGRQKATDIIRSNRVRLGLDMANEIFALQSRISELEACLQQASEEHT